MASETKPAKISVRGIAANPKSVAGFARFNSETLDQKIADAEARARRELERLAAARAAKDKKQTASRDFALRTYGAVALAFVNAAKRGHADQNVRGIAHFLQLHVTRPGARKALGLRELDDKDRAVIKGLGVIDPTHE